METKHVKVKGIRQKKKLFRASEPRTAVLMWGVCYSMNQLSLCSTRPIFLNDDYKSFLKISVDNHFFNSDNMPSSYKLKTYCPLVFQDLRKRFNICDNDFLESFTHFEPQRRKRQNKRSHEKTKSSLMFSHDKKFAVVPLSQEEFDIISSNIKNYYEYIVNCGAQTILAQWLALYRLKVEDKIHHLLVINNLFYPTGSVPYKFTIPISSYNDHDSDKYNNFKSHEDMKSDNFRAYIGSAKKQKLMNQIISDLKFLEEHDLLLKCRLLVGSTLVPNNRLTLQKDKSGPEGDRDREVVESCTDNDDIDVSEGEEIISPENGKKQRRKSIKIDDNYYEAGNNIYQSNKDPGVYYYFGIDTAFRLKKISKDLKKRLSITDMQPPSHLLHPTEGSVNLYNSNIVSFVEKYIE